MQFDWNIEEVSKLKRRASVYHDNQAVRKQLEQLELQLSNHHDAQCFELRSQLWESVEDCAMELDKLLTALEPG